MNFFKTRRSASYSHGSATAPGQLNLPVATPAAAVPSSSTPGVSHSSTSAPIPIPVAGSSRNRTLRTGNSSNGVEAAPPTYTATSPVAQPPILSYDAALEFGSQDRRRVVPHQGSLLSPTSEAGGIRDFFGSTPRTRGEATEQTGSRHDDDDDDDPLTPRPVGQHHPHSVPVRRNTLAVLPSLRRPPPPPPAPTPAPVISDTIPESSATTQPVLLPIDTPTPPASTLPAYSAQLARDELRLISTVHLSENHPAAAFFNAVSTNEANERRTNTSRTSAGAMINGLDQTWGLTTGGKRLKLTLKNGAERINPNGTGPVFLRPNRGGVIEGTVEIGKGEGGIGLEVSVIGMVNTSYYARGQYTLLDTLPIVRSKLVLFPPPAPASQTSAAASPNETGPSTTTEPASLPSTAVPTETPVPPPAPIHPRPMTTGKDPRPLLQQGETFDFSLAMPKSHWRDENIDLPPSCAILQIGMQASVEYVLRVKLSRSRWRLNETVSVPIIYEPRAYINPRRLRLLTTNDAMNPGWRTIPLKGGKPLKPAESTPALSGVECSLLLPTPPILFVTHNAVPPPIPFHLHFHSDFPLPLATFSDPRRCTFVIRLMRVATMKIGQDREIRRIELQSKVELWGDNLERTELGQYLPLETEGRSLAAGFNAMNAAAVSAALTSSTPGTAAGGGRRASSGARERRSSTADGNGRPTFGLRRRSGNAETPVPPAPLATTTAPPITEEANTSSIESLGEGDHTINPDSSDPARTSTDSTSVPSTQTLSVADVHLQGSLQLVIPDHGPELTRRLIQSFSTPEVGVAYVLEVGLQPRKGAVKEAFGHVWGGGIIEVVLGHRA